MHNTSLQYHAIQRSEEAALSRSSCCNSSYAHLYWSAPDVGPELGLTTRADGESVETYMNKTFRLKSSSIARLESDANRLGISVNSLIQNSIQRYIDWDRYADAAQMAAFFPNVLDNVLDFVDLETVEQMAKQVVETSCFKDVCLLIFKRYDPAVLLNMITLLDRFGNNYRMQYGNGSSGEPSVSLYHNYGKKWSTFIGTILHGEFMRLKVEHNFEISDNAIVFKLPRSSGVALGLPLDKRDGTGY